MRGLSRNFSGHARGVFDGRRNRMKIWRRGCRGRIWFHLSRDMILRWPRKRGNLRMSGWSNCKGVDADMLRGVSIDSKDHGDRALFDALLRGVKEDDGSA